MDQYYIDALVAAIEERNKIEREKLEFEKEFKANEAVANNKMADAVASMVDKMNSVNENINKLALNDHFLKGEIDKLKNQMTK